MFDLTGKAALVTGASGGIGGAIARTLHGAGATVGLSGTREAPLQELAAALGGRAFVLPCNLSDAAAVEALPKAAVEAMGSVDILVNNAGITRDNLFMRMSDEEWQSVLDVNLTSTFPAVPGGVARHDEGALGADRQCHLGRRHHGQSGAGQLCRRQGGSHGHVEVAGL